MVEYRKANNRGKTLYIYIYIHVRIKDHTLFFVLADIAEDYLESIDKCCCLIMVTTDRFFMDEWCCFVVHSKIQDSQLRNVFVVYKQVSEDLFSEDNRLLDVFKTTSKVFWSQHAKKKDEFWMKLRLYLPPLEQVKKRERLKDARHPKNNGDEKNIYRKCMKQKCTQHHSSMASQRPLLASSLSSHVTSFSSSLRQSDKSSASALTLSDRSFGKGSENDQSGRSNGHSQTNDASNAESKISGSRRPGKGAAPWKRQSTLSDDVFFTIDEEQTV